MPELMYKKDREPVLVTDDEDGRDVMRKHGWSDDAPNAEEDKPDDTPKKKRGRPFKESE